MAIINNRSVSIYLSSELTVIHVLKIVPTITRLIINICKSLGIKFLIFKTFNGF